MFKQLQQIVSSIGKLLPSQKNSIDISQEFLRYGGKRMQYDGMEVVISDQDVYTGYGYAAIKKRANAVATTALSNVFTESELKDKDHPYLDVISMSPTFSDYAFWHDISTYLDLEGVYYLMAVRNFSEKRRGNVLEFKMLNPYTIKRVMSADDLTVGGYVEYRKGQVREIPKEMIIEIRELNPFDPDIPFAMTDAAKDSQFTLKTAGDYTRTSLKENINAPGIISTEVMLPKEEFKNFVSRVKSHVKGEPLFGNGAGALSWESMTQDLSKASLDKINEIQRDALFTTAGVSKTIMGIEQSGTTRETGKVQKDLFMEGEIIPRIQIIIDALNQDYKNSYKEVYDKTKSMIVVKNPNATDHDADMKDTEVKEKQYDLYQKLVDQGYKTDIAAKYIKGEITLDMLGKPTEKPKVDPIAPIPPVDTKKVDTTTTQAVDSNETQNNELTSAVTQAEGQLKNAVVNIEEQVTITVINRVDAKFRKIKNAIEEDFTQESDVITKAEKKAFMNELSLVLAGFYGIILNLQGGQVMRDRMGEFALGGDFSMNNDIRKYIRDLAGKVSESHINTISNDLYQIVREEALKGKSQQELVALIKEKYSSTIIQSRAESVARTETNRAFTRAQFEADTQFISQNKLETRAFKQWIVRSSNPCPYCQSLASEGPIPFSQNFRSLGESVTVDDKSLPVNFESLEAGNAHPNCNCIYRLIIQSEENHLKNVVMNSEKKMKELEKSKGELENYIQQLEKIL